MQNRYYSFNKPTLKFFIKMVQIFKSDRTVIVHEARIEIH